MVSDDVMYLMENKGDLEQKYGGKYVAIYHKKIVAISKTVHEIYNEIKKMDVKNPLVTYVPKAGEEALLI
jgi:hypothetical protein